MDKKPTKLIQNYILYTNTVITTAYTKTSTVDEMVYTVVQVAVPQLSCSTATIITIIKQSDNESRISLFID